MAKSAAPDIARFKANKGRVTDFYEYNADSIREKKTLVATAKIFEEMAWLCQEITRLGGTEAIEDIARFIKIEKFVKRVCEEQANAVATGAFVKVRADIFAAWRYLVRALETTLKFVLDTEDQFALGERITSDHQERIVLDLEDGMGDDDELSKD